VGDRATDFYQRSRGEELALCQRYYQSIGGFILSAATTDNPRVVGMWQFAVNMRAAPTITVTNLTGTVTPIDANTSRARLDNTVIGAQSQADVAADAEL